MIKGFVLALIEFTPRICTDGVDPGTEEVFVTVTPATAP